MEHTAFSNAGLDPLQLEKEATIVDRSIEEVKMALKEVDFKVVDDILLGIFRKVYPNISDDGLKSDFSFDGQYDIKVKYTEGLEGGRYNNTTPQTVSSSSAYARGTQVAIMAREFVNEEGAMTGGMKARLIKTAIHEIMHVKSFYTTPSGDMAFTGLASSTVYNPEDNASFLHLNEALTEVITDAVYSEYLARTGVATQNEEVFENNNKIPLYRYATYLNERLALQKLVEMISKNSELPVEKAYESLVVEYFKNGDLRRSEILSEIDDQELKEFLEKIETNDSKILQSFSPTEIKIYVDYLHWSQAQAINSIVGRDYISSVNNQRYEEVKKRQEQEAVQTLPPTVSQKLWIFLRDNF